MLNYCKDCGNFNNNRYKDHEQSKNLGFCERFKEVVKDSDSNCIGFVQSKEKQNHFRNLEKMKSLNIQTTIDFPL